MDEHFSTLRTFRRLVPKQSATAAVYRGEQQLGYGIVTNVSEAGACVVTDRSVPAGSDVRLKLSFYQQPRIFETVARVVWSRQAGAGEAAYAGLRVHGVRFTLTTTSERARLLEILQTKDAFDTIFLPSVTEFDRLQNSLATELDALGDKIGKTVGGESV